MQEVEIGTVLRLLKEVENEVFAKSDEEYFHHNIASQLLVKLEVIEEDVGANYKIPTENLFMLFLWELYKTVNLLDDREVECAEKAIILIGPWLSDKKVEQLHFTNMCYTTNFNTNIKSHFV